MSVGCAKSRRTVRTTTARSSRAHCPRCGHTAHRDQISIHNAVLEYVATGERPAYLKPEDKAAWQWRVSEVKAGRY
jgi:hypothetical protein